jgi:hypothetical protein
MPSLSIEGDEAAGSSRYRKGVGAVGGKDPTGEYRLNGRRRQTGGIATGGGQGGGSNRAGDIDLLTQGVVGNHVKAGQQGQNSFSTEVVFAQGLLGKEALGQDHLGAKGGKR